MKASKLKIQELRIGNHTSNGVVVNIFEDHFFTRLRDINFNSKYHEANPIPLTEEWIMKFHPNALDLSNSIFRIGRFKLMWKFSYEYWYVVDDMTGAYMTKIEHVHEWQNFWHIMNGEELTINKY